MLAGLRPPLAGDEFGQLWLISRSSGRRTGHLMVTWSWSLESGGGDCVPTKYVRDRGHGLGAAATAEIMAVTRAADASAISQETNAQRSRAVVLTAPRLTAEDSFSVARILP